MGEASRRGGGEDSSIRDTRQRRLRIHPRSGARCSERSGRATQTKKLFYLVSKSEYEADVQWKMLQFAQLVPPGLCSRPHRKKYQSTTVACEDPGTKVPTMPLLPQAQLAAPNAQNASESIKGIAHPVMCGVLTAQCKNLANGTAEKRQKLLHHFSLLFSYALVIPPLNVAGELVALT